MSIIPFEPKAIAAPEVWRPTLEDVQADVRKNTSPAPYLEVPHPRGFRSVANFDLNSLATSEDVIKLQNQANAYVDEKRRDLDLRNLTVKGAMRDVYEATFGIARDVFRNEPMSIETFTKNNRLRGLGILLIILALLSFI